MYIVCVSSRGRPIPKSMFSSLFDTVGIKGPEKLIKIVQKGELLGTPNGPVLAVSRASPHRANGRSAN